MTMKMTLLDMTQSILGSLGSDQVNSISDTTESLIVAEALRQTYFNMLGRYDMPEHNRLIQLTASGSSTQPTLMYIPEAISRIEWVRYFDSNPYDGSNFSDQYGAYSHDLNLDITNTVGGWSTTSTTSNTIVSTGSVTFTVASGLSVHTGDAVTAYNGLNSMSGTVYSYSSTTLVITVTSNTGSGTFTSWAIVNSSSLPTGPGYQEVHMIPFDKFIHLMSEFNPTDSDVGFYTLNVTQDSGVPTPQSFTIYYRNDKQPQYCSILSNNYILFDSYDNSQDSTLQPSKSMAMAWVVPSFTMSDTFTPDLDEQQFPLYLNDAKSLAFYELKQQMHQKAEEEVARQVVSLQKWKAISGKPTYFEEIANFGRRGDGWM